MRNRKPSVRQDIHKLLLMALISVSCHDLVAQTYEVKFDSINAYGWFGGDDRPSQQRTVGVGQSVLIDTSITLNSFAFYFRGPIDHVQQPDGHGHQVTLTLNVRDSSGVILRTLQCVVPDSFQAGWVTWPDIALEVPARTSLIFTTYLVGGFDANQYTASHGADANQRYPDGVRYGKDGTSDADMESWTDWSVHPSWDSAFHLQGTIQQVTGVADDPRQSPGHYELSQNYPNPFNPSTVIRFQLPVSGEVHLLIYSFTGQQVRQLADGRFSAGQHAVVWDGLDDQGRRVASGSYFYQLTAEGWRSVRMMLYLK